MEFGWNVIKWEIPPSLSGPVSTVDLHSTNRKRYFSCLEASTQLLQNCFGKCEQGFNSKKK